MKIFKKSSKINGSSSVFGFTNLHEARGCFLTATLAARLGVFGGESRD